nr:hypothetical protein HmN_000917400 [Hymenolepis microstoma]
MNNLVTECRLKGRPHKKSVRSRRERSKAPGQPVTCPALQAKSEDAVSVGRWLSRWRSYQSSCGDSRTVYQKLKSPLLLLGGVNVRVTADDNCWAAVLVRKNSWTT